MVASEAAKSVVWSSCEESKQLFYLLAWAGVAR